MHRRDGLLHLTPTDVASHLACPHLTQLSRALAEHRRRIPLPEDPRREALARRGEAHERAYVARLAGEGRSVADLRERHDPADTLRAMRDGRDVIVQAPLADGRFGGRADVLLRVDVPSALGSFSYEPADTKLARDTRAGTILQLCTYAALLAPLQAREPARLHVVTPAGTETYRAADASAYFRFVRRRLEDAVDATPPPDTYPHPVAHCEVCRFRAHCDAERRHDDHLSLVAGMATLQRRELERQGIATVEALATVEGRLPAPPERGATDTYRKLGHQARLQVQARRTGLPPFDLLALAEGRGLARLPEPSPGDVFLDFEGDPFVGDGGLEYLTGWAVRDDAGAWRYAGRWATDGAAERAACEAFLDFVRAHWDRHPGLHVYHFGVYEPAALKRLVSRHGTRNEMLDRLLRGGRFVDLHAVVRESLRIGVERYGLKELEPLTGFARETDLRDAGAARLAVELALELSAADAIAPAVRAEVAAYNREDCLSTAALRDWLEARRAALVAAGTAVPRPAEREDAAPERVAERDGAIDDVAARLLAGVPDDPEARTDAERCRRLLAQTLAYFRREEKCAYWEQFRLRALSPDELTDEREAVAGLAFDGEEPKAGPRQQVPVHRYRFPAQETALDAGHKLLAPAVDDPGRGFFGIVERIDLDAGMIYVRKTRRTAGIHPSAVFRSQVVPADVLEEALLDLGRHVVDAGLDAEGPWRAACDLLCRRPPRRRRGTGGALRRDGEELRDAAIRLCEELDGGVLPVQGPPGSGKTHTGARAIVALARAGRRVGITAVSHKVIANLLAEVRRAATEEGVALRLVQKPDDGGVPDGVEEVNDTEGAVAAIGPGSVVGGTAWLWADPCALGTLDHLFVDEAGQMALAQVLAAARAARNLVLLGDPQQLEQPRRGAHPEGTDVAALVHVLGAEGETLRADQGLFLDRTWRLHPRLCAFTSQTYYEGRLAPVDGLERQAVLAPPPFAGAGPVLVEVPHEGNQASAPEEVDAVERIVATLLAPETRWIGPEGERPLGPDQVLVLAPYNAQVAALRARLRGRGVRVGTVDKFQGQEAAVVVYSCTSSSPADAPRGLRFLYDPHRFNVATSRARALAIVVASPRLFEAECRTPEEVRMVNGLCRFREGAEVAGVRP